MIHANCIVNSLGSLQCAASGAFSGRAMNDGSATCCGTSPDQYA